MSAAFGFVTLALFALAMFVAIPLAITPVVLGALWWTRRQPTSPRRAADLTADAQEDVHPVRAA